MTVALQKKPLDLESTKVPHTPGPPHAKLIVELTLGEASLPLRSWHDDKKYMSQPLPFAQFCAAFKMAGDGVNKIVATLSLKVTDDPP